MSGITTLGTSKKIALICLNGSHVELRYVNTGLICAPIAASRPAFGQCSVDLELYKESFGVTFRAILFWPQPRTHIHRAYM